VRSIRRPQIDGDSFGFAAGIANLGNDGCRFLLGATVVNDDLNTGLPRAPERSRPMPRVPPATSAVLSERLV